jgi:hypothetical protein
MLSKVSHYLVAARFEMIRDISTAMETGDKVDFRMLDRKWLFPLRL